MAKVLKFDSHSRVPKKFASEADKLQGKVIEFPIQKLNCEHTEMKETSEMSTPAAFFGCF